MGELFYVDRENIVTCISIAREQLGKHLPAKKNSWLTIGKNSFLLPDKGPVNNYQLSALQQYQTSVA
jgi:hypothetical protein